MVKRRRSQHDSETTDNDSEHQRAVRSHDGCMAENRQVLIASLPTGALASSDFEMRNAPMPEPADGEVLCRTVALTIGAGQRAGLQGSASYAGAPEVLEYKALLLWQTPW